MAEAFLKVVLDNLSSLVKEEIGMIMGVDDEMQKLSSTLTTIQAVLEDAEDKQIESKPIRDWLCNLAYEIDDILDEYATHISKDNHASSKRSCYYVCNSLKKISYRPIVRRMKQVTVKLNAVAVDGAKFHLREMPVDRPREVAASRETASLLNVSDKNFGRKRDTEKIVRILMNSVGEKQDMSVLPIIGVGGRGKTTLAQIVFNDPRVVEHFEKRIWVCVSDNFDVKTLVKAMIESSTGSGRASDLQHLDALVRSLWELLIHQWIAHGYISSKGELEVEDVGNEICNELVLRSLFQLASVSNVSGQKYNKMYMHDLAQSVMENKVPGINTI